MQILFPILLSHLHDHLPHLILYQILQYITPLHIHPCTSDFSTHYFYLPISLNLHKSFLCAPHTPSTYLLFPLYLVIYMTIYHTQSTTQSFLKLCGTLATSYFPTDYLNLHTLLLPPHTSYSIPAVCFVIVNFTFIYFYFFTLEIFSRLSHLTSTLLLFPILSSS